MISQNFLETYTILEIGLDRYFYLKNKILFDLRLKKKKNRYCMAIYIVSKKMIQENILYDFCMIYK